MRGYGVVEMGKLAWLERPDYVCGDFDAIAKPLAVAACSSDVHSGLENPYLKNLILGHESVGTVIEVGKCVKDFKPGDRVIIPCTTPTWWHPDFQDTTQNVVGALLNIGNHICQTSHQARADLPQKYTCFAEGVQKACLRILPERLRQQIQYLVCKFGRGENLIIAEVGKTAQDIRIVTDFIHTPVPSKNLPAEIQQPVLE